MERCGDDLPRRPADRRTAATGPRCRAHGAHRRRVRRRPLDQPGVVVDVTDGMGLMRQEVFGPVTPISTFSDWSDVAARSNDSTYGLSASAYTNDLGAAMRASRDLAFREVY